MQGTVSFNFPKVAYHQLERIAKRQQRSVAELVEELAAEKAQMPSLEPSIESELSAMAMLSDEVLIPLAQSRLNSDSAKELASLLTTTDRNESEAARLNALVELSDRIMLRKAKALDILRGRGQDLSAILS